MSVEKANNLLQQARGLDATGYNLEMALGCRLEAVVVAITALIERLDRTFPSEPTLRRCEHCGVQVYADHTYHRNDCPEWRP